MRGQSGSPRALVEELRPGEDDDHDSRLAKLRCEVLDQVELRRSRPVDVLEDDERRPLLAEALDQAPHREEHEPLVHTRDAVPSPRSSPM